MKRGRIATATLVVSIVLSACSDSETTVNETELNIQERTDEMHLDGTKRIYSKDFANDFYDVYLEAFNHSQTLYDGIEKLTKDKSITTDENWDLRHKLTAEAEEVRFASKKLGLDSASSEKEVEAENLLNSYIAQIEKFATELSLYYSDYNENNYLDKAITTLEELGLVEDDIELIKKAIVKDSI